MKITAAQFEDLKAVQSTVSALELRIEKMIPSYQVALEMENTDEANKLSDAIDYADQKIKTTIEMQAKSMKISAFDVVDLLNNLDNARSLVA